MAEPKVRFKRDDGSSYPAWNDFRLGDICDPLQYGMNAAAKAFDGKNKYIRITDIDESTHRYLMNDIVSPDGDLDEKYAVGIGDILFARTGASTGKSYLYNPTDGKMYFAGFLIRAHVKEGNDAGFIYAQTQTKRYNDWVIKTSQRSGQPGINAEEYSGYIVRVAESLEEQQKIADFLSSVDVVITTSEKEVANLETQKKAVMKKIFSQEVRFKRADGSDFPEWEHKPLSDVFDTRNGYTPSKSNPDFWTNGTLPWFRMEDIRENGGVLHDAIQHITPQAVKGGGLFPANTVIFATSATIGEHALLLTEALSNQRFTAIIPKPEYKEHLLPLFVYYVGFDVDDYNIKHQGVSTMPLVSMDEFKNYPFPMINIDEQRLIADFLSDFDEAIAAAKKELELWKELKKGILQQMFV